MEHQVALPTLDQLNKVSLSKVVLLQIRCLMTSDLTFQYMLFGMNTIEDIVRQAESLLEMDRLCEGNDQLTKEEKEELNGYFKSLKEYYE